MKRLLLLSMFLLVAARLTAQELSYTDRLYYVSKAWGLVKYNHSRAAACEVDCDAMLRSALASVKQASTVAAFNDILSAMLDSAGVFTVATDTPPVISPELRRNRDYTWIDDEALRSDVRVRLDSIIANARARPNCHVDMIQGTSSWLTLPHDNPILGINAQANFPDEYERLFAIIKYWNILAYFNPNSHILDTPWDDTFRRHILSIAEANNYDTFFAAFKRMTAGLNDAHVEGLTISSKYSTRMYGPKLVLRHTSDGYVVVKSGVSSIAVGDVLISVDGMSMQQREDSLREYISAGNDAVFRRTVCGLVLQGVYYDPINLTLRDSVGTEYSYSGRRMQEVNSTWHTSYYPSDSLSTVLWRKWACNVGYVHMGNLTTDDVQEMYEALKTTDAIIFDVRNYPRGTITEIAKRMHASRNIAVRYTIPDPTFPGSFFTGETHAGMDGNPDPYLGKVIVLCNQQTQSHAEWTCMILKAMPQCTIIGSQTAGADGNVTRFTLTRDIQTGFTSLGVFWPNGDSTQRIGIVPDIELRPTSVGIRRGRDEVLEKALEVAGCVLDVPDPTARVPEGMTLEQNYPNPSNPFSTIVYTLDRPGIVHIRILDMLGRPVQTLRVEVHSAGKHQLEIDTSTLVPGSYRYVLEANGVYLGRTMFVVR